jgi:hypothetical protein
MYVLKERNLLPGYISSKSNLWIWRNAIYYQPSYISKYKKYYRARLVVSNLRIEWRHFYYQATLVARKQFTTDQATLVVGKVLPD